MFSEAGGARDVGDDDKEVDNDEGLLVTRSADEDSCDSKCWWWWSADKDEVCDDEDRDDDDAADDDNNINEEEEEEEGEEEDDDEDKALSCGKLSWGSFAGSADFVLVTNTSLRGVITSFVGSSSGANKFLIGPQTGHTYADDSFASFSRSSTG